MMSIPVKLAAALTVLALTTRAQLHQRLTAAGQRTDSGLGTVESVVLGLGLFLAATAAVAVFADAINSRLAQIR